MREEKERIMDMLAAIQQIEEYSSKGKEYYYSNPPIQSHFILQIQIIGEAAYKLDPKKRGKYPEIPWKKIIGMRHSLVHGYFNIDLDIVWTVVEKDLTDIKPVLERILNSI